MAHGKVTVEVNLTGSDDLVPVLREYIRLRSAPPAGQPGDEPCWVLVKGYHDTGTIDGVFGPYTEAYADWLLSGPLDSSYSNWTKHKLSSGPGEDA